MPPEERFVCRFAAEPPQGPLPYGRWAETLQAEFLAACLRDRRRGRGPRRGRRDPTWFPDRTWAGRTYVPATARSSTGFELFGYVSFTPGDDDDEPSDFYGWADFTDDTAEDHPEWRMDLSEEVVGGWRGEHGKVAAMTLVWGGPLIDGGAVVTAELGRPDRRPVRVADERFTLLAPDAYREDYLEIALYDAPGNQLARESLYEDDERRSRCRCRCGRARDHVDQPVVARLLGGEEAVALEGVGDLLDRPAGVLGVDLLHPLGAARAPPWRGSGCRSPGPGSRRAAGG